MHLLQGHPNRSIAYRLQLLVRVVVVGVEALVDGTEETL